MAAERNIQKTPIGNKFWVGSVYMSAQRLVGFCYAFYWIQCQFVLFSQMLTILSWYSWFLDQQYVEDAWGALFTFTKLGALLLPRLVAF